MPCTPAPQVCGAGGRCVTVRGIFSIDTSLTYSEYNRLMTSFLRFHDLTKSYYEGEVRRVVLQNAHAEFQPGEITAILGRSGSGKSTLLNLISGIDEPDSGQIWVDGRDLTALSERERTLFRRARIGFIFQFFNLIPTLTVGENVSLPLELNRLPRLDAHKKAQQLL